MTAPSPVEDYRTGTARSRRWLVMIACMLAQFMAAVEGTIVRTAMPTIVGDLGGFDLLSWVFTSYLLAQAASTPIYGRLSDLYGRKRVFFAGATLFLVGSTACGFAWGMIPLIAFRIIQGLGAGAIQPVAWTVIGDIYSPQERAVVQGYLSAVFGVSAIAGPVLGAFIVEHMHWSLVFWINIPVGIAAMGMLGFFLAEKIERRNPKVDYIGAALLMLGIGAVMIVIVQATSLAVSTIMLLSGVGILALLALAFHEARTPEPIVPFKLWRKPIVMIGNFGSFTIGAVMICNGAFLPTYVQGAMGAGPTVAGLALGVSSVLWTFGTIGSGRLMLSFSYRTAGAVGGVIVVLGSVIMVALDPARGPLWAAVGAATVGLGMGFSNTTFVIAVQSSVGWGERGAVTAANMFMRTIGQSIGAGIFGAVFNLGMTHYLPNFSTSGNEVDRLLQPELRQSLGSAKIAELSHAIGASMHNVYILAGLMAVVVLVLALRIPAGLNPAQQMAAAQGDASVAGD